MGFWLGVGLGLGYSSVAASSSNPNPNPNPKPDLLVDAQRVLDHTVRDEERGAPAEGVMSQLCSLQGVGLLCQLGCLKLQ